MSERCGVEGGAEGSAAEAQAVRSGGEAERCGGGGGERGGGGALRCGGGGECGGGGAERCGSVAGLSASGAEGRRSGGFSGSGGFHRVDFCGCEAAEDSPIQSQGKYVCARSED